MIEAVGGQHALARERMAIEILRACSACAAPYSYSCPAQRNVQRPTRGETVCGPSPARLGPSRKHAGANWRAINPGAPIMPRTGLLANHSQRQFSRGA